LALPGSILVSEDSKRDAIHEGSVLEGGIGAGRLHLRPHPVKSPLRNENPFHRTISATQISKSEKPAIKTRSSVVSEFSQRFYTAWVKSSCLNQPVFESVHPPDNGHQYRQIGFCAFDFRFPPDSRLKPFRNSNRTLAHCNAVGWKPLTASGAEP